MTTRYALTLFFQAGLHGWMRVDQNNN
jgi:hypothetical protein